MSIDLSKFLGLRRLKERLPGFDYSDHARFELLDRGASEIPIQIAVTLGPVSWIR